MAILGTGLDATSNPDPNTLAEPNPYPDFKKGINRPSEAWTTQAVKAFIVNKNFEAKRFENLGSVNVHFIPSDPAATYTITLWVLSPFGDWATAENLGTVSYTGRKMDFIELNGLFGCTCYFSIDSISAGTLSIAVDDSGLLVEAI